MRGRSLFLRKIQLSIVLAATVLATGAFGVFGVARQAAAQPATSQGQIIQAGLEAKDAAETTVQTGLKAQDLAQQTTQTTVAVKEEAKATWRVALQNTAAIALLNGLNYFAQKVAYDAAVYVAAGGKGQVPLIFDSPGRYFKSVGADAAGEILGSISQNSDFLKKYGVNLCAPSNPRLALNLKLGFLKSLPGMGVTTNLPTPKCTWDSISTNWETFTTQDPATVLDNVGVMFSPGESSLAAAIEINNVALKEINLRKYTSGIEYTVGQGFKSVTDKISGVTKTPAQTVKTTFDYSVQEGFKVKDDTKAVGIGAIGSGAFAVLTPALKTFAGTLTESLMKKVFEKGLISVSDILGLEVGADDLSLTFEGAPPLGGRAGAELANASLLTPKILSLSNYSELTDFAACPTDSRSPNNCVMDQQFYTAVSLADQGRPVTLRQAVQQGFLSRGWQLLPLTHRKNLDFTCYNEAFCYSNLVKLRKARIIPIGWELAANSPFNDANRPVTLGEAMDRFNDCPMMDDPANPGGPQIVDESKLPDPLHPWCHLIDPEWVLKYPVATCRQLGPGPLPLSSQSPARVQSCVDVATCVAEDASGNCVGGYGYCVREKSAWKFDADACPAQYASCTTYRRVDGATFSFLSNTLDAGPCNSQNAGCRQYSLSQNSVPNSGFEDAVDGDPRDWNLSASAGYHRGGRLSMMGSSAIGLDAGSNASASIGGLLPGTAYRLSVSVLQEDEGTSAIGTVRVAFLNAQGASVATNDLSSTCDITGGGTGIELDVISSGLGYLSGICEVTLPADATAATLTLTSNAAVGNRTWFDEIGFFGASYSIAAGDAVLLNGKAETCSADDAGCTEFVRLSTGTLNMLRNPSFETAKGDVPAFWEGAQAARYESGTLLGDDGASAYALTNVPITQEVQGLLADAAYSFSIRTQLDGSGGTTGTATLQLRDSTGAAIAPLTVSGCAISGTAMQLSLAAGQAYERSACMFTTPTEVGSIEVRLRATADAPRLLADAVQLELSVNPTPFHEDYSGSAARVSLKKAPQGLNCVGANPPAECANYAPSCRRDEVGCNAYAPVDGGSTVPAVTTDADLCPNECAGYDTFRQEPSNFSDARFPLFLIPSTAAACTAAEAGCSEFTNIERLAAGGEAREYYSYLRLCAAPGPRSGTYYTWEGNDARGFQLRTWALLRSNIENAAISAADPSGGNAPCTKLAHDVSGLPVCADDAISVAEASCEKALVGVNPDCREFYDEAGNIHYRLYSKTVVSTEDCKEYRITTTTEPECRAHGGLWRNGECRYRSYAAESVSCRAEAAGCRAYSGNASRNVRIAFSDTFETGTTDGWTATPGGGAAGDVVNSTEAVSQGGRSLKLTRASVVKDVRGTVVRGRQYILNFWAKGTGDLDVRLSQAGDAAFTFDRVRNAAAPVALTTEWRPYQVGPVEVVRSLAADEHLIIARTGAGAPTYFIDNVELREVTGSIFLVENSWETPAACDQSPTGDPAPQYMLGCRAYRDRENALAHFKSFAKLCRAEAVGCEALYDTRNTASPFPATFKAVCTNAAVCNAVSCPCAIGGEDVCQVTRGATSCRYDADTDVAAANISPEGDTVRVQGDGIVYLVNDPAFRCAETALGCTQLGDRTMKPDRLSVASWTARYYKNLPDTYDTTLCRKTEEFCQSFTRRADGAQVHFKDPDTRTCEFREIASVATTGINASGWFRKGSNEPCDPGFLEAGSRYGVWKNSDAQYDGWVGTCENRYDMCKEFIDPVDLSGPNGTGKAYYAIMNDRLDTATCQGRASLQRSPASANDASSCVLFWQTDDLKKTYDAAATYAISEAENGALVAPVSTADNSANVVIRVKRDRQCGEWLDCRTSETVFNPSSGTYQNVCTAYSLCAEFERVGNVTRCIRYVESSYGNRLLTDGLYASRDTGWQGMEYSGYAIPNRYPVEQLVTVNIGPSSANPDMRLVRVGGTCTGAYGSGCGPASDRGTCLGACGTDGNLVACPSGETRSCVYPIDGSRLITNPNQLTQAQTAAGYPGASCRAYPQENAPFPSTVADPSGWNYDGAELNGGNPTLIGPSPAFGGANVCQRRLVNGVEVSTCECSYFIARYGSQTKYLPAGSEDIPQGYCVTGAFDGFECDPLATGARTKSNLSCCTKKVNPDPVFGGFALPGCDDGAQCVRLGKLDRVVGYEGQCIERDYTRPINGRADEYACLTWRPVGLVGGSRDIYNQYQSAGYFATEDRRFYCVGDQASWALMFDIPSVHTSPTSSNRNENFAVDTNGDTVFDYRDMDIMNYFGPGTVSNGAASARSQDKDCEDEENGKWCVWPSTSSASYRLQQRDCTVDGQPSKCVVTCTAANGVQGTCGSDFVCQGYKSASEPGKCTQAVADWYIDSDAKGILGCYEVADGGSVDSTYIDYPYVGPPMYRQQLSSIYFQVTDDIYDQVLDLELGEVRTRGTGAPGGPYTDIPTNPHQNVIGDCNDEDDDNIDNEDNDSNDAFPVSESQVTGNDGNPDKGRFNSVFHLNEGNNFKVDPSDGEGIIVLSATFDQNGRLQSVRVAARDGSDEGAFGIIRMGFVFKPGCQEVVQVDERGEFGATVAFTDTVNPIESFQSRMIADVNNRGMGFADACQPYGAIGSVTSAPTNKEGVPVSPWTYVARRVDPNFEQCTQTDFTQGATYLRERPEDLPAAQRDSSLRRLFRKVYGVWRYLKLQTSGSGGVYELVDDDTTPGGAAYDESGVADLNSLAERGDGIWHPPRIASVDLATCDAAGICEPGIMDSLTINGKDDGAVLGADGTLAVSARFYGWASHNSMPILQRTISWGDFTPAEPPSKGWYRNQKPVCSPDTTDENAIGECRGMNGLTCDSAADCPGNAECVAGVARFGNTPGACSAAPFQFDHTYTCSARDLNAMPLCAGSPEAATNAPCYRMVGGSPICIYRPKVQIVDNWGWCNCTGAGCAQSGGAYKDGCDLADSPANARPWTEFAGEIRLAPTIEDAEAASPGSAVVGGGSGSFFPVFAFPLFLGP